MLPDREPLLPLHHRHLRWGSGFSAPFFPEDIGIDEERVVTWLLDERLVSGMKRTRTPVICLAVTLSGGVHSIARSNGCVVECAHAVEFDGAAVCHVAT